MKLEALIQLRPRLSMMAGGPGSGRHPGTGMTHPEFADFAQKVAEAHNANRSKEDALRAVGNHDEANKIYESNKVRVRQLLDQKGVKPAGFDAHMKDYSKHMGVRAPNVKMARMFRNG